MPALGSGDGRGDVARFLFFDETGAANSSTATGGCSASASKAAAAAMDCLVALGTVIFNEDGLPSESFLACEGEVFDVDPLAADLFLPFLDLLEGMVIILDGGISSGGGGGGVGGGGLSFSSLKSRSSCRGPESKTERTSSRIRSEFSRSSRTSIGGSRFPTLSPVFDTLSWSSSSRIGFEDTRIRDAFL